MVIELGLLNGIVIGIEHIQGREEDAFHWVIEFSFLCLRLDFVKYKD